MSGLGPNLLERNKLDSSGDFRVRSQHIHNGLGDGRSSIEFAQEETWLWDSQVGVGGYALIWKVTRVDERGTSQGVRAVKQIPKRIDGVDINYSRELEAAFTFSDNQFVPCFVRSYGWFEDTNYVFLAMEYFNYKDLGKFMSEVLPKPAFSEVVARCITSQLVDGLVFMHRLGFAHRDLKPANILVVSPGPQWQVKLGDFGISKRASQSTKLRTVQGTGPYMAPEIRDDGSTYTFAVDMWSLGITVFQMLTGELIMPDGIQSLDRQPLLNRSVSENCQNFLQQLLVASIDQRLTSASATSHPWLQSMANPTPSPLPTLDSVAAGSLPISTLQQTEEPYSKKLELGLFMGKGRLDTFIVTCDDFDDLLWKLTEYLHRKGKRKESQLLTIQYIESGIKRPISTDEDLLQALEHGEMMQLYLTLVEAKYERPTRVRPVEVIEDSNEQQETLATQPEEKPPSEHKTSEHASSEIMKTTEGEPQGTVPSEKARVKQTEKQSSGPDRIGSQGEDRLGSSQKGEGKENADQARYREPASSSSSMVVELGGTRSKGRSSKADKRGNSHKALQATTLRPGRKTHQSAAEQQQRRNSKERRDQRHQAEKQRRERNAQNERDRRHEAEKQRSDRNAQNERDRRHEARRDAKPRQGLRRQFLQRLGWIR